MNTLASLMSSSSPLATKTPHSTDRHAASASGFESVLSSQLSDDEPHNPLQGSAAKDKSSVRKAEDEQATKIDDAKATSSSPMDDWLTLLQQPPLTSATGLAAVELDASLQPNDGALTPQGLIKGAGTPSGAHTSSNRAASTAIAQAMLPSTEALKLSAEELPESITSSPSTQGSPSLASSMGGTQAISERFTLPESKDSATPQSHVATRFGQDGWDKAVSQRVSWMVQDQLKMAHLTLNPPNLGPVQVQVQMDQNNKVHVHFMAAQPEVRQALQEAIPALESMMNQSGLQLGQSDVSDHSHSAEQDSRKNQELQSPDWAQTTSESPEPPLVTRKIGAGLLNTFA